MTGVTKVCLQMLEISSLYYRVNFIFFLLQQHLSHQQVNPSITNPFLLTPNSKESSDNSTASIISLLQEPSARRVATFYDIKNSKGRVGRLCVFKTSFRLGEDIVGLFNFAEAATQCMQYSVSLHCEEEVKFDQKKRPKNTIKQSFQEFSFGYDEVRIYYFE